MTTKTISGTYSSGYTLHPPTTVLTVAASGYVGGYGVIAKPTSGTDTVVNYGTVIGYKNVHFQTGGVDCNGVVVNGSLSATHAYIEGEYFGVYADRVSNFGTITGAYNQIGAKGYGVSGAAYILNGSSSDTSALIDGKSGDGISPGTAGGAASRSTVINFGTILGSHYGVEDGTVAQCQLTNGTASDTRAQINDGISFLSAASVVNFGTITGSRAAADVAIAIGDGFEGAGAGPGMVINGSGSDTLARIEGVVAFSYGSLVNYGTISLAGSEMFYAAVSAASDVVTNFGMIDADAVDKNTGVGLTGGGALTNGSASDRRAFVYGYVGVRADGAATVTNFGTIEGAGGDAVEFSSSAATLIVGAGAVFIGRVADDAGGGALELAGGASGAISNASGGGIVLSSGGPAATFTGFGAVRIDAGASFMVSGVLTIGGAQTLDLSGTLSGNGALSLNGGTLNIDPGAALSLAKVALASANLNVGALRLTYAGDFAQLSGVLTVAAGGAVVFSGAANTFDGTLTGAGLVEFTAGGDALKHATIGGRTEVGGSAVVTLSGATTILAGALLLIEAPGLRLASAGAELAGNGALFLGAAGAIAGVAASSKLIDENDLIYGGGDLGGGQMTLVNEAGGTIRGSLATALTIDTGANTVVNAGLIEAVGAGGVVIGSAISNSGTLFANGGNLTAEAVVVGAGVVRIRAATADFAAGFSENVTFVTSGELELARSVAYRNAITGFSHSGATSLDLRDIAFGAATKASFSGTAAAGVLTVTDGTHTARITLEGDYRSATFAVASDGHGGSTIVDSAAKGVTAAPSASAFAAAMAGLPATPAAPAAASETATAWSARLAAPCAHAG